MNTQPETLRLADALLDGMSDEYWNQLNADAAALLRTQHAEIERKDALLRQALAVAEESQTYVGSATWSPSMTNELNELCLAITKELTK